MQTGFALMSPMKVFEAYRELIEQVASDAYDTGAPKSMTQVAS
jgi:hypothetical protein